MKAKDDNLWSQMTMELRATEEGRKFLDFLEFWFTVADKLIADGLDTQMCNGTGSNSWTAVRAMRAGLAVAEEHLGFIDVDWIGQMLAVAGTHWAHGEEMGKGLTFIEVRVLEEAYGRTIGKLEQAAKMGATDLKG